MTCTRNGAGPIPGPERDGGQGKWGLRPSPRHATQTVVTPALTKGGRRDGTGHGDPSQVLVNVADDHRVRVMLRIKIAVASAKRRGGEPESMLTGHVHRLRLASKA
jgi:hypothetical protein